MLQPYKIFEQLSADNHVAYAFTTKPFSFHPQARPDLAQLRALLGVDFQTFISGRQEHTANLEIITVANLATIRTPVPGTDGFITDLPGVALAVYTADCQAIFLYDPTRRVIANVHSGWRGTLQTIAPHAVELMRENFNCCPADIEAYICPSILKCCFEIGSDVADQFTEKFGRSTIQPFLRQIPGSPKFHLDTVGLNRHLLEQLGLQKRHIVSAGICTKCHSDTYHSYRTHPTDDRNLALICLK